jgi:hypothetical protein
MTRHAQVGRVLTDRLIDVVDNVRRKVHAKLGTRQYRVQIITRRWSSGVVGEGTPVVTILEIDPRPLVTRSEGDRLSPAGRENQGDATITQISLRYSAEELQPEVPDGTEIAWRVIDTGGQRQPDQWYVISADPVTRRGDLQQDQTDWKVVVKQTSAMTNFDGGQ